MAAHQSPIQPRLRIYRKHPALITDQHDWISEHAKKTDRVHLLHAFSEAQAALCSVADLHVVGVLGVALLGVGLGSGGGMIVLVVAASPSRLRMCTSCVGGGRSSGFPTMK